MVGKTSWQILTGCACIVGAIAGSGVAFAQISPGELSAAHASLEGMTHCTSCHSLGKTVSNENCLSCHKELRTRVAARTGFHARLADRQCIECHKEHHGRNFTVVRFDPKSFDHDQTGFRLEGKHREKDCVKCHTRANITARDVLDNRSLMSSHTYLGLVRDCKGCHADIHRDQLGTQCQQCHTADGWKPAPKFVHDRAKFRLTGKHEQVQCGKCHPAMGDDKKTMKFVGLSFASCSSCHVDPHRGRFHQSCESCHSTNSWKEGASKSFNHSLTRFPLEGLHATTRCEACHPATHTGTGGTVVQNFEIKKFQKCTDCHVDAHKGEFSGRPDQGACESCHSVKGYVPSRFVHATAKFLLKGKHVTTECKGCHGAGTTDARGKRLPPDFRVKKFLKCAECHEDGHGGQFAGRVDKGACESCHAELGFAPSLYTARQHDQSRFTLVGSHEAIPCARCHSEDKIRAKSTRQFIWKQGMRCESCHKDVHGGQFKPTRYAGCEACHGAKRWNDLVFSHDATAFPLTGKHLQVACVTCHTQTVAGGGIGTRRFAGTPSRCVDCHPASGTQNRRQ